MPTYQYRCASCGNELEVVQRFTDPALTDCEDCGGRLRKVFTPVGVVFKGSGFYATDNRSKGKAAAAKPGTASTDGGGGPSAAAKTESSPASSTVSPAGSSSTGSAGSK